DGSASPGGGLQLPVSEGRRRLAGARVWDGPHAAVLRPGSPPGAAVPGPCFRRPRSGEGEAPRPAGGRGGSPRATGGPRAGDGVLRLFDRVVTGQPGGPPVRYRRLDCTVWRNSCRMAASVS